MTTVIIKNINPKRSLKQHVAGALFSFVMRDRRHFSFGTLYMARLAKYLYRCELENENHGDRQSEKLVMNIDQLEKLVILPMKLGALCADPMRFL